VKMSIVNFVLYSLTPSSVYYNVIRVVPHGSLCIPTSLPFLLPWSFKF